MSPRRITLDSRIIEAARYASRRILEPEVMDESGGVDAYLDGVSTTHLSRMDDSFVRGAIRNAVPGARVLDVGTGTGQIALKLALKRPDLDIVAIDLSDSMLTAARARIRAAGVQGRVRFRKANARTIPIDDGRFDLVLSNSLLHHLPDPVPSFNEMARVLTRSGRVFIRDLRRPIRSRTEAHIRTHGRYYKGEMKRLFADSVRAAFQVAEIRDMVAESALAGCKVRPQFATYVVIEGDRGRRPVRRRSRRR